ncbi:MAG: HAD family phosphatase [Acidobacteria bacterium]|nr:MAG: HAD family phosphatase [Acidobacteriota bacterium]GIK78814.1 MAG: phosphoglycolate phosphatase [Actinomycetes bacterium]
MAEREPRGLLVDFGGVLTTNIWASFDRFCDREGLERGTVLELFRGDGEALALLRSLERGAVADHVFERDFAEMLGVEPEGLIERLFGGLRPERRMIDAVGSARAAGIRTGLITNSWGMGIYDRAPLDRFDATVISGDVGLHKPQPEIYLLGAERIGVPADRCVFVDDLRENVAGAEAVGMAAILHRDPATTIAGLERLLGLRLEPPPGRGGSEGPVRGAAAPAPPRPRRRSGGSGRAKPGSSRRLD